MIKKPLKLLGIIGDPVAHSLSPLMQNAALAHLRLPYLYVPFQVTGDFLKIFLARAPKRRIVGLNVTVPHKQVVIPFLDSLGPQARLIGAVNTVVIGPRGRTPKGALGLGPLKLKGYNTDGVGYIASLKKEARFDVRGKHVLLVGAGGSARAIAVALGTNGAREVLIANRTAKKAFDLARELNKKFSKTVFAAAGLNAVDPYHWTVTDLLVNATTMGMKGSKTIPLPLSKLPQRALVSDIVYTPLMTPLLKKAKKLGLKIHPGWGMLLYQGALSFELFTGRKAPVQVMKKALLDALKV